MTTSDCSASDNDSIRDSRALTVLGLSSMRSWSKFMPGIRTVILRGPLKPRTFVSWQRQQAMAATSTQLTTTDISRYFWSLLVCYTQGQAKSKSGLFHSVINSEQSWINQVLQWSYKDISTALLHNCLCSSMYCHDGRHHMQLLPGTAAVPTF